MPVCGCLNVCNCLVTEDSFWGNDITRGRNFTTVEGNGSPEDPFVIHFMDQEEYRPLAAEWEWPVLTVANATGGAGNFDDVSFNFNPYVINYETPIAFVLREETGAGNPIAVPDNYWYVGASLTFAEAADAATNERHIALVGFTGNFPANQVVLAGASTTSGSADPLTLQCEAWIPGLFFNQIATGSVVQALYLYAFQNSGAPLGATNVKVWVTQL